MQKHTPTIEEVPDEADLKHPVQPLSTSILEDMDDSAAPGWATPVSVNAAGKQKERAQAAPKIDLKSEESFPGLGGAPTSKPNAPGWPKFNGANGTPTNGSATDSGANTPATASRGPQSLTRNIQAPMLVLQKNEVLPKNQLKKPVPELIKDINKKMRTNITMTTGEAGALEFRDSSNAKESYKSQAIRDLGAQIGAKVCKGLVKNKAEILSLPRTRGTGYH